MNLTESEIIAAKIQPPYLLLLPPAPEEVSLASFQAAYDGTISEALKGGITTARSSGACSCAGGCVCMSTSGSRTSEPRSASYQKTQDLLALLYKLVVIIAARDGINVEDNTGVDVRVIPVAWSPAHRDQQSTYAVPVITIETLAWSQRPWLAVASPETDAADAMMKDFMEAWIAATNNDERKQGIVSERQGIGYHPHVAVGGTFDHLHIGHKLLLTMTLFMVDFKAGESSVTIGLTGDELLKNKKYAEVLESWDDRQEAIQAFCDSLLDFSSWPSTKKIETQDEPAPNGKAVNLHYSTGLTVRCIHIQDPFGPTITEEAISALVLSAETRSGGEAINKKRTEKGWAPLAVYEVDVLDADAEGVAKEGFEAKLSSTAIRQRLASRAT